MEYKIISAATLDGLVSGVNEAITDGWRPTGGPFVIPAKDRVKIEKENGTVFIPVYAQSLIRR